MQGDYLTMHLNTEVALDLVEGRLPNDEEMFWKRHIDSCKDCSHDVSHWRQLKIDLKRSHLRNTPQQALDMVVLSQSQPEEGSSTQCFTRAAIVFDSFFEPDMSGVRGSDALARQIVLRADEFDVHVKIWGDEGQQQMIGQVLPRNGTDFVRGGAQFHLLQNGERVESAVIDEIGEFVFAHVPDGLLSIQIELPDITVIGALNFPEPD